MAKVDTSKPFHSHGLTAQRLYGLFYKPRLESPNKVALLDGKRYNAAHGTQAFWPDSSMEIGEQGVSAGETSQDQTAR